MSPIKHVNGIKVKLLLGLLIFICQSAVFTVPLEYRMFLNNHLEIKIPPGWKVVTEEDILRQFPQEYQSSQICYEKGEHPWLGVRQKRESLSPDSIAPKIKRLTDGLRLDYYGIMDILASDTVVVNGRTIGYIEYVIYDTYALVFMTDVEGKFLECGFECDKHQMTEWAPVAKEMMRSVKVQ